VREGLTEQHPGVPSAAVWEFRSAGQGQKFYRFDDACHSELDKHYEAYRYKRGPAAVKVVSGGQDIVVAFEKMEQHVEGSNRHREVRRRLKQQKRSKGGFAPQYPATPCKAPRQNCSAAAGPRQNCSAAAGPAVSPDGNGVPVWQFRTGAGFRAFDADCQDIIEAQYQAFCASCGPPDGKVQSRGLTIFIDFCLMTQTVEGSQRKREVRRNVAA
jgi:hypothetical protein